MGRTHFKFKNLTTEKKAALAIPFVCIVLGAVSAMSDKNDDNLLQRKEIEGVNTVTLVAKEEQNEATVTLDILPTVRSEQECKDSYEEFFELLKDRILGENESFEKIDSDMNLVDSIESYPFSVEYKVMPRDYLSREGKIVKKSNEDIPYEIVMTISCDYFEKEESVCGVITNTDDEGERFERMINEYLNETNQTNRTEKELVLADTIQGKNIDWTVKKKKNISKIPAFGILAEAALFMKGRIDIREKKKKRKEKIREEYPEFAMKYALLFNAGLPHIKVMERISKDAKAAGKNGPLYEELDIALKECESGISSKTALIRMAESCETEELKYFTGLICQNMRKGGKDIAKEIKIAARESMNMKRDEFKKKSETAGTKLTIPMVILLAIVFVLIMYPAFSRFSF